jgi:glutaredoxin
VSSREVVLYGRDGCCLCDEARQVLERVRARQPFTLVQRDIDTDDALQRAYLERIPVIAIDGVEVFELFVDESELERRLSAPRPADARGSTPGAAPAPASSLGDRLE